MKGVEAKEIAEFFAHSKPGERFWSMWYTDFFSDSVKSAIVQGDNAQEALALFDKAMAEDVNEIGYVLSIEATDFGVVVRPSATQE